MSNQSVRVVIELDGGIVQKVVASAPVTYLIHDLDVEGNAAEDIATRPNLNGPGMVNVFRSAPEPADVVPDMVSWVFDAVTAEVVRSSSIETGNVVAGSQKQYSLADWQSEVAAGDTVLGFEDWCIHRAEAEQTLSIAPRCIFSETLKGNFVRVSGSSELHDIAISRAVVGQVILEKVGLDVQITDELFESSPDVGESFCWVMSSFSLDNWRGKTIGQFLQLWGFGSRSDLRNALGLPQSEANKDGVHQRYVSVADMHQATPVGSHEWVLPDGTAFSIFVRSDDARCLQKMNWS